jgi:hypothetical protein
LKNIKDIRLNASKKSGGTSDFIIKNKIIYYLKKFKTKGKSLLDFGAGKGELINILKKFDFLEVSGADLFKKPKSLNKDIKWYQLDLNNKFKTKNKFDFVIGNPPFNDALDHVQRALSLTKSTGGVGFLLRIGFFASISRFEFWQKHPAKKVWVLAERPSFAHGTTDAQEYAFFYWTPGYKGATEIEVIRWKD